MFIAFQTDRPNVIVFCSYNLSNLKKSHLTVSNLKVIVARQQTERQHATVSTVSSSTNSQSDADTLPPALKRFKFLANKMMSSASDTSTSMQSSASTIQGQIENYLCEIQQPHDDEDALTFWSKRHASYSLLADLAEDLIAASASQAFVERIFSLCGWLTSGRRNRLTKSLEMRVFLKLNKHLCTA